MDSIENLANLRRSLEEEIELLNQYSLLSGSNHSMEEAGSFFGNDYR